MWATNCVGFSGYETWVATPSLCSISTGSFPSFGLQHLETSSSIWLFLWQVICHTQSYKGSSRVEFGGVGQTTCLHPTNLTRRPWKRCRLTGSRSICNLVISMLLRRCWKSCLKSEIFLDYRNVSQLLLQGGWALTYCILLLLLLPLFTAQVTPGWDFHQAESLLPCGFLVPINRMDNTVLNDTHQRKKNATPNKHIGRVD